MLTGTQDGTCPVRIIVLRISSSSVWSHSAPHWSPQTIIWSLMKKMRAILIPLFHGLHRCLALKGWIRWRGSYTKLHSAAMPNSIDHRILDGIPPHPHPKQRILSFGKLIGKQSVIQHIIWHTWKGWSVSTKSSKSRIAHRLLMKAWHMQRCTRAVA